jgi:hypothetical protein
MTRSPTICSLWIIYAIGYEGGIEDHHVTLVNFPLGEKVGKCHTQIIGIMYIVL